MKTERRRELRSRLRAQGLGADFLNRSECLSQNLLDLLKHQDGEWAAFRPHGFEPDIRAVFTKTPAISWSFPRVNGDRIEFLKTTSFVEGPWKLREPDPNQSERVELKDLKGLLIPALGFDSNCNRLGRGGGYYDRALSEINNDNPDAVKIGVAFDLQVSEDTLPLEPFDIPMDWVVTETRRLERKSS